MIEITLYNPYLDKTYVTKTFDLDRWKNFLINYKKGNEDVISFEPINLNFSLEEFMYGSKDKIVTICPRNWATIEVRTIEEK